MPLVSVVIPVHNGQAHLRGSLSSVIRQTLADIEILVVDDASTDNTREIIAGRFSDDGNVVGPLVMAGVRFALSDAVMLGGEVRYQGGKADLDPSQGFAGDRLDLGGYSTQVTLHVRFD